MLGTGTNEVQKTLKDIVRKRTKEQRRLEAAPSKVSASLANRGSTLLGILYQQNSSAHSNAVSDVTVKDHVSASACPLKQQLQKSAAQSCGQQHTSASAAIITAASASEHWGLSECPLCGAKVPIERLQAHVHAELLEVDRAARRALPSQSNAAAQDVKQMHGPTAAGLTRHPALGETPRKQLGNARSFREGDISQSRVHALQLHRILCESNGASSTCKNNELPAIPQRAYAASRSMPARSSGPDQGCAAPSQTHRQTGQDLQGSYSAAQQTQLDQRQAQAAWRQAGPRHKRQQERRWQEHEQPLQHCCRGPVQGKPAYASQRQPSTKRRPQVPVFGAGLRSGRQQYRQQRAPISNASRQQSYNHYENGHGLWDGEMAGLDGLETVGLDCWEGFGTMSMGRL